MTTSEVPGITNHTGWKRVLDHTLMADLTDAQQRGLKAHLLICEECTQAERRYRLIETIAADLHAPKPGSHALGEPLPARRLKVPASARLSGREDALVMDFDGERITSVAFDPTGSYVVAGGSGLVLLYAVGCPLPTFVSRAHQGAGAQAEVKVAWGKNGLIASGSSDGVRIWNQDGTVAACPGSAVPALAWSAKGVLLSSHVDGTVRMWDQESGQRLLLYPSSASVHGIAWSPDSTRFVTSATDDMLRVWSGSGRLYYYYYYYPGNRGRIRDVAWSPVGHMIAFISPDTTLQIIKAESGLGLSSLQDPERSALHSVTWSPCRYAVAFGTAVGTVLVCYIDGRVVHVHSGHTGPVLGIAWSPDGSRIASAGADGTVQVWEVSV